MLVAMDQNSEFDGDLYDSGGALLSDHEAERQVVGTLILKPAAITNTLEILRPENFHDPFNRRIYEILLRAYDRDEPVTISELVAGMGGEAAAGKYIASIVAKVDHSIDVAEVADHLFNIAERRAVGSVDDVGHGPGFISKFGGLRWEEIGEAGSPQYEWIIEDVIPKAEITLAYGDSGTGKSFAIFDMSLAIARGIPFYAKNVEPGLVIYVAAEAGKGFSKRKIAYVMHHQINDRPIPFYLTTRRPDFFSNDIDCEALIVEIAAIIKTYNVPLVLIVLDTLSALTPGMNENASQDVSKVRARLQRIMDAFGAATILIHHKPKGGSTPRGHGSLTGDFETTIEFETTDQKTSDGLPIHKATGRKQREGKKGLAWEFALPVIKVGVNKWGNDETSCVVVPFVTGRATAGSGFHATPNELMFLHSLFAALDDHGVMPPAGLPVTISKAVDLAHVRAEMRQRMISGEDDAVRADARFRSAFKRAADVLQRGAVIGYRNPMCWYTGKAVSGLSAKLKPVEIDP